MAEVLDGARHRGGADTEGSVSSAESSVVVIGRAEKTRDGSEEPASQGGARLLDGRLVMDRMVTSI
jgi:hypothetical protein